MGKCVDKGYTPYIDFTDACDGCFHEGVCSEKGYLDAFAINGKCPYKVVDVASVVHAEWHLKEYEFFTCTNCGGSYHNGAESTAQAKSYLNSGNYCNYCPNCGAKMDGGTP